MKQRTATINKIGGSQEKKIFKGKDVAEIIEKIKADYDLPETELQARHDRGQDWVGYGNIKGDIHSIRIEKV